MSLAREQREARSSWRSSRGDGAEQGALLWERRGGAAGPVGAQPWVWGGKVPKLRGLACLEGWGVGGGQARDPSAPAGGSPRLPETRKAHAGSQQLSGPGACACAGGAASAPPDAERGPERGASAADPAAIAPPRPAQAPPPAHAGAAHVTSPGANKPVS